MLLQFVLLPLTALPVRWGLAVEVGSIKHRTDADRLTQECIHPTDFVELENLFTRRPRDDGIDEDKARIGEEALDRAYEIVARVAQLCQRHKSITRKPGDEQLHEFFVERVLRAVLKDRGEELGVVACR